MRVLHLIPALSGGGVLNVSINLTKAFAKLGHELYVIGPRNKELMKYANMFIETKAPLDLVSDPFYAYAYTLRNVNTVKSLTKEEKVDIILTHGPLVVLCMYEGINIPCFSVVHGTYGNEVRWMRYHPLRGFDKLRYMLSIALTYTHDMKLYSLATKKGLKLIAVSERTRQELIKNGTLGENVFSILNGVDIELFRPINREFARQYVEKKYGIRLDDFIIAHVGLGPIKGTHVLVKALAILKKRVKFTALFAGRLGPKSYREYIEKIVRELNLSKAVKMLGWVPYEDLSFIYNVADVIVVPSYSEGGPLTTPESLACGTPVIATNVGGNMEYLKAVNMERNLIEIKKYDFSIELFSKIYDFYVNKYTYSRENLAKTASHHFSWTKIAQKYITTISKTLAKYH